MYCRKCGRQIADGSGFCLYCGASVVDPGQTAHSQAPAAPVYQRSQPGNGQQAMEAQIVAPPGQIPEEGVENRAPKTAVICGAIALVMSIVMYLVYRFALFPLSMNGASFSRMIGPLIITILFDLAAFVMIVLNAVFGIMGFIRGIIKKKNLPLGIVGFALLFVNVIVFLIAAAEIQRLTAVLVDYWLGSLF